jgi:hypothetical protein
MSEYRDYDHFRADLYCVLMDKAEGEAYDKMRGIKEKEGVIAYLTLYRWFTEISGLGFTEQARELMHPEPPKREEDLAEAIDHWTERIRRIEHMYIRLCVRRCSRSRPSGS